MPFANYTDFADCVSKNQDKDDPEAYCASLEKKTEEPKPEEPKESLAQALEKHFKK